MVTDNGLNEALRVINAVSRTTKTRPTNLMTKPLPFTEASLARAIRGVERAGRFVVGVKGDGTLLVSDRPLPIVSLVPEIEQDDRASKWEDQGC
jgi:hypothetical protein